MNSTSKRKYFGQAHAMKVNVGNKAVNLQLEPKEAFKLAEKILSAGNAEGRFDIAIHHGKKTNTGRTQITITRNEPKRVLSA